VDILGNFFVLLLVLRNSFKKGALLTFCHVLTIRCP
jgi:hypothetical protein